ncbi:MAG: SHOCT domain-containing protein [Chloroflexi bacterium]|nr:SHOCT domain-containing protein [Chloroflexota bacterium]
MWGYGLARGAGWGAWMAFGWLFMVAFWGAVIVGIILLARAFAGRSGRAEDSARSGRTEDSAIEILRRRYAAGEISREQYEAMRADLEDASKTRR